MGESHYHHCSFRHLEGMRGILNRISCSTILEPTALLLAGMISLFSRCSYGVLPVVDEKDAGLATLGGI